MKHSNNGSAVKRRLDRTQVLEAARAISDISGVNSLSIKQLAENLKIRPPSVYAHFAGLPELRRELALRGYAEITQKVTAAAVGLAGPQALLAMGHAYLDFIRTSPGLYSAIVPSPDVADTELRGAASAWLAVFYRVIGTFRLSPDDAIHALRGIRSIVHGFGMLEMQGAFRSAVDRDTSFVQVLQTFIAAIEHQALPEGQAAQPPRPIE